MLDVESLLLETAEQPPCGPDLEYDPAFTDLELAARGKPEQQFGDTVIAAEEPAWGEVRDAATELLRRSKDLRVATLLVRALVRTEDFPGLLPGLRLLRELLERYWGEVHPRLDSEDDDDPTARMNALAPLIDGDALIRDLRGSWLVRSRQHGQIMVRDIEVALGKLPPRKDAEPVTQRQIDGVLAGVAAENPSALELVGDTLAEATALGDFLADKVGAERAPDFKPLLAILQMLDHTVRGVTGGVAAAGAAAETPPARGVPAAMAEKPTSAEIRGREEALLMIDRIVAYFERNEPSNPAPLLLKRARRLAGMNFVEIIKDMAPESLAQIETIAGGGGES